MQFAIVLGVLLVAIPLAIVLLSKLLVAATTAAWSLLPALICLWFIVAIWAGMLRRVLR